MTGITVISSCDPPQAPFGEGTYIEKSREIVVPDREAMERSVTWLADCSAIRGMCAERVS